MGSVDALTAVNFHCTEPQAVGELLVRWIKFSLEFGEWFSSAMGADHPTIMQAVRLSLYKAVMPHAEFPAVPA